MAGIDALSMPPWWLLVTEEKGPDMRPGVSSLTKPAVDGGFVFVLWQVEFLCISGQQMVNLLPLILVSASSPSL